MKTISLNALSLSALALSVTLGPNLAHAEQTYCQQHGHGKQGCSDLFDSGGYCHSDSNSNTGYTCKEDKPLEDAAPIGPVVEGEGEQGLSSKAEDSTVSELQEQESLMAAAAVCDPSVAVANMGCEIDMTHPTNPLWPCAVPGITLHRPWNGSSLSIRIDMDAAPTSMVPNGEWDILEIVGSVDTPSQYAINIGNSPSNNGWSGDSGDSMYDAEAQLFNNTLTVWHGDMAGSGLAMQANNATSASGYDSFEARVCDGGFDWESGTNSSSVTHNDSIFQLRQPGDADGRYYYVSFNQVVSTPWRSGTGVEDYPYLVLHAL